MAEALPKVLVVDDNKQITELISDLTQPLEDEFKTVVTNHPEEVMGLLARDNSIRVIVTDFKMPNMNGLELILAVKEKYPHIQFIMMTGYGTPSLKQKLAEKGVLRYLEKPLSLRDLISIIQETLQSAPSGFEGFVPSLQLPDVIQLIAVSRGDGELVIQTKNHKGRIFFRDGTIIHAECKDQSGLDAFYTIANSESGSFVVHDLPVGTPQTIFDSWQALILEAARQSDEANSPEDERSPEQEQADADDIENIFNQAANGSANKDLNPQPAKENDVTENPFEEPAFDDSQKGEADWSEINSEVPSATEQTESPSVESADAAEDFSFDSLEDSIASEQNPPNQPSDIIEKSLSDTFARDDEDNVIGLAEIESSLEPCVLHYLQFFPPDKDKIPVKQLPLGGLPVKLRKQITYYLHVTTMAAIRSDDGPFDFANEAVAGKALQLVEALLDSWQVSKDEYANILRESIRFRLAASLDPPAAVAELLHEQSDGKSKRMSVTLAGMIRQNVAVKRFESSMATLSRSENPDLDISILEETLKSAYTSASLDDVGVEVGEALDEIYELISLTQIDVSQIFKMEVMQAMFIARGVEGFANWLEQIQVSHADAFAPTDIPALIESFQQQSESM